MDTTKDVSDCCIAAIKGDRVPPDLGNVAARASVIRGVRLHYTFATSPAVTELCEWDAQIARARNARLIMSNVIPEKIAQDEVPYCIWHPDFASEDTYRQLARNYPNMRYHAGRACAAAGYHGLYAELDILPDVSIAEEARESETPGGRLIYDRIMAAKHRHLVMDDYNLSVTWENPPSPAYLNGDTQVRWQLQHRVDTPVYFGAYCQTIEEDWNINETRVYHPNYERGLNEVELRLLYEPLPLDLPTLHKSLLVHMAAYDGNIDRYARLTSPHFLMSRTDLLCVIRGIYHHTMFARWWADQIARDTARVQAVSKIRSSKADFLVCIKQAVMARQIMVNAFEDIQEHGWPADTPYPYLIWWPVRPHQATLLVLAEKVPEMREAAAVAAICCNYKREFELIYDMMAVKRNSGIRQAVDASSHPFYREHLKKMAAKHDLEQDWMDDVYQLDPELWKEDKEPSGPLSNVITRYDLKDNVEIRDGPYFQRSEGPDTRDAEYAVWLRTGMEFPSTATTSSEVE